jgi:hypothetical protein
VRLAPIKSRVPLGSRIRVRTYLDESFVGVLLDIDDEYLIISADNSEIILEANVIANVERLASGWIVIFGSPGTVHRRDAERMARESTIKKTDDD